LELCHVKRHIFPAHFVERADDATLENRPEAFDGLSVDRADDILALGVINNAMRLFAVKTLVASPLIRAKQADFVRDRFADERGEGIGTDIRDYPCDHIPLAADGADNWRFAGTDAASSTAAAALIPMSVFGQAADESFIDFDNAAELVNVFHKSDADAMAHIPSRFQGAETHITPNLASAYSLYTGEHQMNNAVPIAQRLISVFENRARKVGETICASLAAIRAFPVPFPGFEIINPFASATRTADAFRPTLANEVSTTGIFVWKHRLELRDGQLVDLRGLFCSGHNGLPFIGKTVA
jgi:hypothetical protein